MPHSPEESDPLAAALSAAGVLVLRVDAQGRILYLNPACEELTGYAFAEVEGRYVWDLFLPSADAEAARSAFDALGAVRFPLRHETPWLTRTRARRKVAWSVDAVRGAAGQVQSVVAVGSDVTERDRADDALRRGTRALRTLTACNHAVIAAADETHLIHEVCRVAVHTGGYRFAWVGYARDDAEKSIVPAAQAGHEQGYLERLRLTWADTERGRGPTGTAVRTAMPVMVRNILTDARFAPWRDEASRRGFASVVGLPLIAGGRAFGALTIYAAEPHAFDAQEVRLLMDLAGDLAYGITSLRTRQERQRAQAELDQLRHRSELILSAAGEGIYGVDLAGNTTFVNPAAARLTGWAPEELLGRCMHDVLHHSRADGTRYPKEQCPTEAALRDGAARRVGGDVFWKKDGTSFPVDFIASPMREEDAIIGAVIVFQDVTRRKRAESNAAQAHLRLLQAEQERKRFHRQVIRAVTHGRLHLVDPDEIPTVGEVVLDVALGEMRDYPPFRDSLREVADARGMDHGKSRELMLAAAEAVINCIKHAGGGRGIVFAGPERIAVRVADQGKGIRPEDLPASLLQPGFSTKVSLGMGYTLMLQMADTVWLATGPEGTIVQVEECLHGAEMEEPPILAVLERF